MFPVTKYGFDLDIFRNQDYLIHAYAYKNLIFLFELFKFPITNVVKGNK